MPKQIARRIAEDLSTGTDELEAAILYLSDKIRTAEERNEPVPFLAYRNRFIFECSLRLRGRIT